MINQKLCTFVKNGTKLLYFFFPLTDKNKPLCTVSQKIYLQLFCFNTYFKFYCFNTIMMINPNKKSKHLTCMAITVRIATT